MTTLTAQKIRFASTLVLLFVSGVSAFSLSQTTSRTTSRTASKRATARPITVLNSATAAAVAVPEGLVKTIVNGGDTNGSPIGRGDIVTVKYTCYSTQGNRAGNDSENVLLARSDSQKMVVGDGSMVPGWDAALRTMASGERAVVRLTDPSLGYGSASPSIAASLGEALGVTNLAASQLEFDIDILQVQPAAQAAELFDMNFDAMAALEDNDTPKTAEDIAAAYQVRMANKAPEKEGLEGWIDTVRNYYFFGFFEGETGEEAPWYLKPSITFPIAFAVVGAAFYVSLFVGAISEKGAQSVDELDVIVTTTMATMMALLS